MDGLVSASSRVSVDKSGIYYTIPDALDIQPNHIYDDHNGLYRIALGKTNMDVHDAAMYESLFHVLDTMVPFTDYICFEVNGNKLVFTFAYITKTESKYGTFYDIEATEEHMKYIEKEHSEQAKS